jgi:hypothetical protein
MILPGDGFQISFIPKRNSLPFGRVYSNKDITDGDIFS